MKLHALLSAQILLLLLALSGLVAAESPPLLTSGVEVSASNERTALSRTTRKLASTVDVKIKNTSDRLLEAPVHVVVTFTAQNGGNLVGLTASSLQGGLGVQPYQTFYKDLSVVIGHGLAVGAETTFSFSFERPPEVSVSYAMALRGIRNRDPVAATGGPYAGQQGVPLAFDASASSDPDGDALTFAWDFGDGSTAAGATPQHAFEASGLYTVTLTATDARGAVATRETQVPIAPSGVFALARTRTLDGNGHPLGEVTISQTGPDGSLTLVSDSVSGFASLGGVPGDHSWTFGRSGYLTSYRKSTLLQGQVKVVAFPWLAALNPDRTTLSLLNPTPVKSPGGRVALTMPTGAFEQVQAVAVTELHGQSLPLPLPFGWSPLAAFHLDMAGDSAADIAATVKLLQAVTAAQTLVLARVDTAALNWHAESLLTGTAGDTLAVVLRHPGSYAVVLADTLPAGNPAAAQAGQALPAGTAAAIAAEVTAVGSVNPATSAASLDPAKVTAQATVDFTNASQPLASGAWFLADVAETYDLRDGQAIKTPDYDATFYAYQAPGDADPATATATFPMQPRLLFGPDQLSEAHIKVDVLALNQFGGGVLNQDGGQLSLDGLQVGVPAGALSGPAAAEIRLLSTANLAPFLDGLPPLLAFELNLPTLADGTALSFVLTQKLAANSQFVLARCVSTASASGLQPVLRLHSDSQGKVTSAEPATGPRLPGITGSGQYVVVQIPAPEALITGLVRKIGATLLPGALVRVSDEPWLSLTGGAGTFAILAKPGQPNVTGTDPADGNSGQASPTLADANSSANVEIQTVVTGPRVVSTTPADGATKVRDVTPIVIRFSKDLNPSTVPAESVTVTNPHGVVVVGSLSLSNDGRVLTFLPVNPLEQAAHYTVKLAATVADTLGRHLDGAAEFSFSVIPFFERPVGAQLVIYEPGGAGYSVLDRAVISAIPGYTPGGDRSNVAAVGSAGCADPDVPVILVNNATGATATVLSKPDGSFANFISAEAGDFVSAVFVNSNGTRVTVPATRQIFDDGRVGLYKTGGILEAQTDGGPVQVLVSPGAIPGRSVFTLEPRSLTDLLIAAKGVQPENAKILAGFHFKVEGDVPKDGIDVSFPMDPASLGTQPGEQPENATLGLAVPNEVDGEVGYQFVDKLRYENGKVFSNTSPFSGLAGWLVQGLLDFNTTVLLFGNKPVIVTGHVYELTRPIPELSAKFPFLNDLISGQIIDFLSNAGGLFTSFPGVSDKLDSMLENHGFFKPASGAFVYARSLGTNAGIKGRIQSGVVYATADRDGMYALALPITVGAAVASVPLSTVPGYVLVASHPLFQHPITTGLDFSQLGIGNVSADGSGQVTANGGEAPFFRRNVIFVAPQANGNTKASVSVEAALQPGSPALNQRADLTAVAYSASGDPSLSIDPLKPAEVVSTSGTETVSTSDVTIDDIKIESKGPGIQQLTAKVSCTKAAQVLLRVTGTVTTSSGPAGNSKIVLIRFGEGAPTLSNSLQPADPKDKTGPDVLSANLVDGGTLPPSGRIVLQLTEPVQRNTVGVSNFAVVLAPVPLTPPVVYLSADQKTLEIYPAFSRMERRRRSCR